MNYFDTQEYLDYLKTYCLVDNIDSKGRVAGTDIAYKAISLLEIQAGDSVVEIGCGIGRILQLIFSSFSTNVLGCDISSSAINYLKSNNDFLKDRVHQFPSDRLDFLKSSSIDYIVTWGVFELTDQSRTLIEISRVLKIGGKALLGSIKNGHALEELKKVRWMNSPMTLS